MQETARLLELLAGGDVEFVVVGGYAAVLHGSSYVTQDLDICIVCSQENIERLRRLLKDLDPRHRMTAQKLSFLETPPPGTELKKSTCALVWECWMCFPMFLGWGASSD